MIDRETIIYTADIKIPLSADDMAMECGWRMHPIPPDDSGDWVPVDTRSDKKTGWARASALMLAAETSRRH